MTKMTSSFEEKVRDALQQAVAAELERKRKLGQYAVFWRDGQPVLEGPDAPPGSSSDSPPPATAGSRP